MTHRTRDELDRWLAGTDWVERVDREYPTAMRHVPVTDAQPIDAEWKRRMLVREANAARRKACREGVAWGDMG